MEVHVKLYGTLGNRVPGYDHQAGLAVEVLHPVELVARALSPATAAGAHTRP